MFQVVGNKSPIQLIIPLVWHDKNKMHKTSKTLIFYNRLRKLHITLYQQTAIQ